MASEAVIYVWATLVSPHAVDILAAGLVRAGFAVGPFADNEIQWSADYATLTSLKLTTTKTPPKNTDLASWALETMKKIMAAHKCSYHSLIAINGSINAAVWSGPHCFMDQPAPIPPPKTQLESVDRALGDEK